MTIKTDFLFCFVYSQDLYVSFVMLVRFSKWKWNGLISLHQFHFKHMHANINLFHRDAISNRVLCGCYVEKTYQAIMKNLFEEVTESIICSNFFVFTRYAQNLISIPYNIVAIHRIVWTQKFQAAKWVQTVR